MRLPRRIAAALAGLWLWLRAAKPRPASDEKIARAEFSTHPGGKGLRFTERVRDAFRQRWLRLRR